MNNTLPTRRALLGLAGALAAAPLLTSWETAASPSPMPTDSKLSPDQALALLKEGNEKFVTDAPYRVETGRQRRLEIAREQHPFAVLVGCSDSRVPPELLFGRGLGELFIVRNAGNTVDMAGLGSIEYAVEHLGVSLVVVLGHERCGAVQAAVQVVIEDADPPDAIGRMVEPIVPAVLRAQRKGGDLLNTSVHENVLRVVDHLRKIGPFQEPLGAEKLRIVGARYDLDDGRVDFLDA